MSKCYETRLSWPCHIKAEAKFKRSYDILKNKKPKKKNKKSKLKNKKIVRHKFIPYKKYLKSKWWRLKRQQKLQSVGFKCEKCGSVDWLQVHHLHYKTLYRENNTDLQVLCGNCHQLLHGLIEKSD